VALFEQLVADGVAPAPVLGDEVYGGSSELRAALRELGLEYFLNAGGDLLAWTQAPRTRLAKKYWALREGEPAASSLEALAQSIPRSQWHPVSWRAADGSKRHTRIAWQAVHVWSDLDRASGRWPQSWLVVDWPEGHAAPYHLYLAWFKRAPRAAHCLRLSRGRFAVEQFFQRDKTDLGLDHYEGRSWRGFHHHLVLAAVAYLFVTVLYLRAKKNFWAYVGSGLAGDPAVAGAVARVLPLLPDKMATKISRFNITE
jgi:SRSO17 transposase